MTSGGRAPWQLTVFAGVLPLLALALLPVAGRRRRVGGGVALLAAACVWLALGRYGGLYRLAWWALPRFDAFRYPEKLLPYAQVLLALLAGIATTAAWRRPQPAARVALGLGAVLALTAAVLALAGRPGDPALATWLARAREGAGVGALITGGLGVSWLGRHRWPQRPAIRLLVLLPAALALGQLLPVDARLLALMSGPTSVLAGPSVAAATLRRRGVRAPGRARVTTYAGTDIGLVPRSRDASLAQGFAGVALWDRAALTPDQCGLYGIEATTHYLPVVTPRYRREIDRDPLRWITREAGIFNGRFDILDRPTFLAEHLPTTPVVLSRPDLGLVVVENAGALPRAFVTTPRFVAGPEAARRALDGTAVRRGQEAVVEGPPPPGLAPGADRDVPAPARVVSYRPEEVVVDARPTRPGLLVLNDAWMPGWEATVDGHRVPIRRANYLVRGVLLPAGAHRVVFRYPVPASLWLGLGLSVATLAGLLGAWIRRWRRPQG